MTVISVQVPVTNTFRLFLNRNKVRSISDLDIYNLLFRSFATCWFGSLDKRKRITGVVTFAH